jgi:hypothetical protein
VTATITSPRFSDRTYAELISEAQSVLARNVDSMLTIGALFVEMLKHQDEARIARDVDFSGRGVKSTSRAVTRIAGVAKFWGKVRIAADRTGRQASYGMYDRVAHDPLMTQGEKAEIKKHARRGRHIVEQLITEYRGRHLSGAATDRGEIAVRTLRTVVARIEAVESVNEDQLMELRTLHRELSKQLRRLDQ